MELVITFYDIHRCGYYNWNKTDPEFGHIDSILDELKLWTEGKPLKKTCTYESKEESNLLKAFCFDMCCSQDKKDWLITIWNEVPSVDGKMASVDGDNIVGNASVNLSTLPANGIPGYPTYFWIIPEENKYATVTELSNLNGNTAFKAFMSEFVAKFTKFVAVTEDENIDHKIVGFRKNNEDEPSSLYPKFLAYMIRNKSQINLIRTNCKKIRKIIRKNKLETVANIQPVRNLLSMISFGLYESELEKDEYKVKIEIDHQPTLKELDGIIDTWTENHENNTSWDNVGFQFTGEGLKTHWLSHSIARYRNDFVVEMEHGNVIKATSLLDKLVLSKKTIMRVIDE